MFPQFPLQHFWFLAFPFFRAVGYPLARNKLMHCFVRSLISLQSQKYRTSASALDAFIKDEVIQMTK